MKTQSKLLALLLCLLLLYPLAAPAGLSIQTQAASSKTQTIKLNRTSYSVYSGKTFKLKVSGTKEKVKWSSSNEKVATVKKGVVTTLKAGKATIKAKVAGQTLKCALTVKSALKVSAEKVSLTKGKSKKVVVTLYAEDGDVTCKIGKPSVVSYKFGDWNGKKIGLKFTAKKAGTTNALITNSETGDRCKIRITVTEPPERVVMTAAVQLLSLDKGESQTVVLTGAPAGEIITSVAQPAIAKCDWDGKWGGKQTIVTVTGLANGKTTVTLTNAVSKDSVTLPVTVGCIHVYSTTYKTDKKPTCTAAGSEYNVCVNCGARGESRPIPALGHDFAEEFTVDVPATCSKEGVQSRHCTRCDAKTDEKPVPKTEHNFGAFTVLKEATCVSTGSKTRLCRDCGVQENVVIPETGHDFAETYTVDVPSTCVKAGSESRHCKHCSEKTDVRELPLAEHEYAKDYTIDVKPTCSKPGMQSRHCKNCDAKTDEKEVPTTAHDFSEEYTVDEEPTCAKVGWESRHCKNCDATTDKREIEKKPHEFGSQTFVDKEPTCTEPGESSRHCLHCSEGRTDIKEIPAKGHTFSDVFTVDKEPTCTEAGSKSRHCTVCGEKTDVTEIPFTGHEYIQQTTEDGATVTICKFCGEYKK